MCTLLANTCVHFSTRLIRVCSCLVSFYVRLSIIISFRFTGQAFVIAMPVRRTVQAKGISEGLALDAEATLLPDFSPATYAQRLEEFQKMNTENTVESVSKLNTLVAGPDVTSQHFPTPPRPPKPLTERESSYDSKGTPQAFAFGETQGSVTFPRLPSAVSDIFGATQVLMKRKSLVQGDRPQTEASELRRGSVRYGLQENGGQRRQSLIQPAGQLEHQLFKSAPSSVLAKLSSFVNNRNGDGGSWQRLGDLLEMYRKGCVYNEELEPAVTPKLRRSAENYPYSILKRSQNVTKRGHHLYHSEDPQSEDAPPEVLLSDWSDSIASAISVTTHLFGMVATCVPSLANVAESTRKIVIGAVYENSRNIGAVLPLPTSLEGCCNLAEVMQAKVRVTDLALDAYAVSNIEVEMRRAAVVHSKKTTLSDALAASIKTEHKLKKRFEVIKRCMENNIDRWRTLTVSQIFKAWRALRGNRLQEQQLKLDLSNTKAELEYLANTRKTQQAELARAANDRSSLADNLESEKSNLAAQYSRTISGLEQQVANLKLLVQKLKNSEESAFLKEEMAKVKFTNDQLEQQVVKLVEHISAKEQAVSLLEAKNSKLVGVVKKLGEQIHAISANIGGFVQENRTLVSRIASIGGGAASIPPLASWLSDIASTGVQDDVFIKAMLSKVSPGKAVTSTEITNPNWRLASVRIRDFGEGSQILDAYAAAIFAIDRSSIPAADAAAVFLEEDPLMKASMILDLAGLLCSKSTKAQHVGSLVRNPAGLISSTELATSTGIRVHIMFVTSLLSFWLSSMSNVALHSVPPIQDCFITQPLELEQLIDNDPVGVCASRWEQTRESFNTWRAGAFSIPYILIDYLNESFLRSADKGDNAGKWLSSRRNSALIRGCKSPEEKTVALSRIQVADALRVFAPVVKKKEADSQQTSIFEEQLSSTVNDILAACEVLAGPLCSVFRAYAAPTSELGFHFPLLCLGCKETFRLAIDLGLSEGGKQVGRDDVKEILQCVIRKRAPLAKGERGSKKNDDELKNAILSDEFVPVLLRLFLKSWDKPDGDAGECIPNSLVNAFALFVRTVSSRASVVDGLSLGICLEDPEVYATLDVHRSVTAAIFQYACLISEGAKESKKILRDTVSIFQFQKFCAEVLEFSSSCGALLSTARPTAETVADLFLHVQASLDKPLLFGKRDFEIALVGFALLQNPSPMLKQSNTIRLFFCRQLQPFAISKKLPEA